MLLPANAAMLTPAVFMHQEIAAPVRIKSVIYWSLAYSTHWVGRFWRRIVWQLTDEHTEPTWIGVRGDIRGANIYNGKFS